MKVFLLLKGNGWDSIENKTIKCWIEYIQYNINEIDNISNMTYYECEAIDKLRRSRMDDLQSYLDKALKEVQLVEADDKPNFTDYDIEAELCDLIANTRNQLGITQKQLAEKSVVSQDNISTIEYGSYKPSIPVLKRIADGLGKRLVIEFADREEVL